MRKVLTVAGAEFVIFGIPLLIGQDFLHANAFSIVAVGLAAIVIGWQWDAIVGLSKVLIFGRGWLSLEDAARFYRDEAHRIGATYVAEEFDGLVRASRSKNPLAEEFRQILMIGMNEGLIEVWGTPLNGRKIIKLSPNTNLRFEDSLEYMFNERDNWDEVECNNGARYNNIQIKRSDINRFIRTYVRDDRGRKRRIEPHVSIE